MVSMDTAPFWPRKSPHFLAVRGAVRESLERLGWPEQVYVGLSGGADSLALVAALCAEAQRAVANGTGMKVHALCIDHGLQDGSRDIAKQAAAHAERWGAAASVIPVEVARGSADGMEAEARRVRYQAFSEAAGEMAPVFVAHTAEDQAETLLLSSLRGHISTMAFDTEIEGAKIYRPLLGIRRADTLGACAELGVQVWHDPHNEREDFRRVAIRKTVVPMLSEIIGGDAVAPLAAAANDAAADDAVLHSLIPQEYGVGGENIDKHEELDCNELSGLAQPVRQRIIARWLVAKDVLVTRAGLAAIDALCSAWSGQGGVAVGDAYAKNPRSRLEVVRVGGKLRLLRFHAP